MDHYGATNPAEFFAVATETFFEKPRQMANNHTELFETLKSYYRVDPREWQAR
jgi:Mlc titration factor MtfA (ptsG expression regulator)